MIRKSLKAAKLLFRHVEKNVEKKMLRYQPALIMKLINLSYTIIIIVLFKSIISGFRIKWFLIAINVCVCEQISVSNLEKKCMHGT